jgi:hypothetical protein
MLAAKAQSDFDSDLPKRITSHESKDDLLKLATNRFCDTDSHNRLSLDQFREAFDLLIGQVSAATRQVIARNLAFSPATPRSVALYLALEPLQVSASILMHSRALGQLDLLRIVDRMGLEYARVIASRPDIGPSVVKQLSALADADLLQALQDNGALTGTGLSRSAEALFTKIETRDDSEQDHAPVAPVAPVDHQTPQSAPLAQSDAEQALLAAAARGGRIQAPALTTPNVPTAPGLMINPFDFGNAFEKTARSHSLQGMAVLMQKRFGLAFETAQQVLEDKSGDTLAVLLNAADVTPAQANRIQMLTHATIGLSSHNALRAMQFFAQLNPQSSRTAVEQWPKAKSSGFQHQPQLQEGNIVHCEPGSARPQAAATQTEQLWDVG